jgi:hypothetical protein
MSVDSYFLYMFKKYYIYKDNSIFLSNKQKGRKDNPNSISISEKTPGQRPGLNTYLTNNSSRPRQELLFIKYVFFENRPTFTPKGQMTAVPLGD